MIMNIYHCEIDLRDNAKALVFAVAVEAWMEHLLSQKVILGWRLCRRKLGFGAPQSRDFLLEIELKDMPSLIRCFAMRGKSMRRSSSSIPPCIRWWGSATLGSIARFQTPSAQSAWR